MPMLHRCARVIIGCQEINKGYVRIPTSGPYSSNPSVSPGHGDCALQTFFSFREASCAMPISAKVPREFLVESFTKKPQRTQGRRTFSDLEHPTGS